MHGRILGFKVSVAHVWAEQQHQLLCVERPGIKVFNPFERD